MKTIKLLLLCAWLWLLSCSNAYSQTAADTARLKKIESSISSLEKKQDLAGKRLDTLAKALKDKSPLSTPVRNTGLYVVVLPIAFTLLLLVIIIAALKGFRLGDALAEKNPNKVEGYVEVRKAELANAATFPAISQPALSPAEPPKSTSRLIAFLSGIAAIIISICLTTFYIYYYLTIGTVPSEFKDLWWGVIVLGIGIIPYASAQFVSHKPQQQS